MQNGGTLKKRKRRAIAKVTIEEQLFFLLYSIPRLVRNYARTNWS